MTTTTVRAGLSTAPILDPQSPISNQSSLSELRRQAEKYTAGAEELGWFDQLLEIGRHLGEPVATDFHGAYRVWVYDAAVPLGPIIIAYRQRTGRLIKGGGWDGRTSTSIWETIEEAHVYLGPRDWDLDQVDLFGVPTFFQHGTLVCHYVKSSHPTGDEPRIIVPGRWTNAAVMNHPEAADRRLTDILDRQDAERQALLATLLVGVEI